MKLRLRSGLVTFAAAVALTALALHRPGFALTNPDDPTAAVVVAAQWLAWVLAGYLLLAVVIAAAGHLVAAPAPGRRPSSRPGSRPRRGTASRLTPRVVRRLVDAAVGATALAVTATAVGPVAAYADSAPRPHAPAISTPLDWPGLAPAPILAAPARRHGGPREEIVVRVGDSLWSLTARTLGPGASAAEVAAAWPRLYATNRTVIGPDPGLIHPGQRLVPPAAQARSPR